MAKLIITIDGPAASGKSTVAQLLAERLKASFLDTGAMYRAITLAAMQAGVAMSDEKKLLSILNRYRFRFEAREGEMAVYVNDIDMTEQIRKPEVTANVRYIASSPKMREKLVEMQRQFAVRQRKIVTEGRDQGTVVFPDADIKFYLTADKKERARRRQAQLQANGCDESLQKIQKTIEDRDKSDQTRSVGPLKPANDAIIIDTTELNIEQVVEQLINHVRRLPSIEYRTSSIERRATPVRHSLPVLRSVSGEGSEGGSDERRFWFWFARWACRVFCMLLFRWRICGANNIPEKGGFILVSNHQSYLDPIFVGGPPKRHLYFLARDDLFNNWFFGPLLKSVNAIPVKREQADLSTMKKVISKLKQGYGVCLFPEGERCSNGKIAPFKKGFALLARRAEAAIVPAVVDGAFECWPRHKKIFSPGATIVVNYGRPITAQQIKKMSDKDLSERLTNTLRQMQNDCRLKQGKKPYDYGL